MIEQVILGMLMESKMSGYDIKKTTEQTVGLYFTISYGSLYPALKRLVDSGMVIEEETNNSKNKKLYELTDSGRQSFLNWLREPLQANRREYLVKIFFYDYLDQESRMRNLQLYLHEQTAVLSRIEAVESIVNQELTQIPNKDDYYYRMSVMHYGLQFYRMELGWLQQLIEKRDFR